MYAQVPQRACLDSRRAFSLDCLTVQCDEDLDKFGATAVQNGLLQPGVEMHSPAQRRQRLLNFALASYAPVMPRLRACKTHSDLQVGIKR